MDNSICLSCEDCERRFYIELFTEDDDGYPNPEYCPFCGSSNMNEINPRAEQAEPNGITMSDQTG